MAVFEILEIPLNATDASFSLTIQLGETVYGLGFTWNTRNERWFFDLTEQDGTPIVMGQPVFVSYDVLGRFKDSRLPPGKFFFFDTSGKELDPGRVDLGSRVQCFYQEAE